MKRCAMPLAYMVMVLLSFSVSSCGDDDDFSDEQIVGSWRCIHNEGYEDDYSFEDDLVGHIMTFHSDHTVTETGGSDFATWKISGDKIILDADDDEEEYVFKIVDISENRLVLEEYEKDGDYEYYQKTEFERVK